jgi:hypothetical protein
MTRSTVVACSLLALSVTGCASDTPPAIAYDDVEPALAREEQTPSPPVKIVPVPHPLPLPGQLKTITADASVEQSESLGQIGSQRRGAELDPGDAKTINAITVYPFVEGALYQVYAAPEQVTDITLQPGEQLKSVAAGDTVRWVVGDTASGAGADERVHILVKPFAADLSTNLVILTDRRAYHLELTSTADPAMSAIAWTLSAGRAAGAHEAQRGRHGPDAGRDRARARGAAVPLPDRRRHATVAAADCVRRWRQGLYPVYSADRSR